MGELVAAVVGALVGAIGTYAFQYWHEGNKAAEMRRRHLDALSAEINYNARLAATYVDEGIVAPLYRFPRTVYDTVYATLVSEVLSQEGVAALTGFYSLVDQMNRGLETIARHIAEDRHDQSEHSRLLTKAGQMRHPDGGVRVPHVESEFYAHAIAAISRHRQGNEE